MIEDLNIYFGFEDPDLLVAWTIWVAKNLCGRYTFHSIAV